MFSTIGLTSLDGLLKSPTMINHVIEQMFVLVVVFMVRRCIANYLWLDVVVEQMFILALLSPI
jgi:hypothetical protein